jgi:hypothetical protein
VLLFFLVAAFDEMLLLLRFTTSTPQAANVFAAPMMRALLKFLYFFFRSPRLA